MLNAAQKRIGKEYTAAIREARVTLRLANEAAIKAAVAELNKATKDALDVFYEKARKAKYVRMKGEVRATQVKAFPCSGIIIPLVQASNESPLDRDDEAKAKWDKS